MTGCGASRPQIAAAARNENACRNVVQLVPQLCGWVRDGRHPEPLMQADLVQVGHFTLSKQESWLVPAGADVLQSKYVRQILAQ